MFLFIRTFFSMGVFFSSLKNTCGIIDMHNHIHHVLLVAKHNVEPEICVSQGMILALLLSLQRLEHIYR